MKFRVSSPRLLPNELNMNETPKSKSGRRIPLALLIWLILFTLIVLVQTAGLVAYIVKHPHDEHIFPLRVFILRFFICGVVGATIPFCLWLFVHWLCCWRNLRRTLIGLAVLATLIAIFYARGLAWQARVGKLQTRTGSQGHGVGLGQIHSPARAGRPEFFYSQFQHFVAVSQSPDPRAKRRGGAIVVAPPAAARLEFLSGL